MSMVRKIGFDDHSLRCRYTKETGRTTFQHRTCFIECHCSAARHRTHDHPFPRFPPQPLEPCWYEQPLDTHSTPGHTTTTTIKRPLTTPRQDLHITRSASLANTFTNFFPTSSPTGKAPLTLSCGSQTYKNNSAWTPTGIFYHDRHTTTITNKCPQRIKSQHTVNKNGHHFSIRVAAFLTTTSLTPSSAANAP
ncbi:unnamed protein product, partial [Ectocarpus sp. 6 AP-2014]